MTSGARRQAPQDQPSAHPGQPASESPAATLMVELVIQYPEAAAPEATSSEATSPEAINPEAANPEAANPEEAAQPVRYALVRTLHRVPAGTTIRQLLQRAAASDRQALQVSETPPAPLHPTPRMDEAVPGATCPGRDEWCDLDEPCDLVQAIEAKALGLSRFGRRAWLDDPLRPDDRVEVLCPILADAKAARFARVAKSRAERTDGRWGRRGVADRQIRATKRRGAG